MSQFVKFFVITITVLTASVAQAAVTVGQQAGYCAATADAVRLRAEAGQYKDKSIARLAGEQHRRLWQQYMNAQGFQTSFANTKQHYTLKGNAISSNQLLETAINCSKNGY